MAHGTSPVDHFLAQNLDAPERQGRLQASTIRNLCILILAFIMASALIFVGGMKSSELRTLAQDVLKKHHSSLPSSFQDRVASGTDERGDSTAQKTNAQVPPDRVPDLGKLPSEISSLNDVMNAIRVDWRGVIKSFLDTAPSNAYSAKRITSLFESGVNNVKNTSMLVSIRDREVTFTEEYPENRNGRAPSAKYIINKIVDEAEISLPDMTFLLIINDGYPTDVVTFGPARHWKSWNSTIPVPLGNDRGLGKGWGTPIEGWDSYVEQNVVSSHGNYPWESKFEKAVFRGSLSKRSSKLGSCNVENNGACEQAENWRQVTRGILYEKTSQHPDLFDVAITALKMEGAEKGWSAGAPVPVEPMQVQDYQKFKYILNVGNNQGKVCPIRRSVSRPCHITILKFCLTLKLSFSLLWSTRRLGRANPFTLVHEQRGDLPHG